MSSQQATTGPTPMEGVERTNTVMIRKLEQGRGAPSRRDPYAIDVDRGRSCYTCGGFGHMTYHYRNQEGRVVAGRRLEYEGKRKELFEYENHLKGKENLDTLN